MKEMIDAVSSNPVLLIILLLVIVLLVFSVLKKLFKIALFAVAAILVFFGYIYFTDDEPEKEIQKYIEQGTEVLKTAKGKTTDAAEKLKKTVDEYKK